MKYVDKEFIKTYDGRVADIVAKPYFDKKDKLAMIGGFGAIALGLYTVVKKFFKAGCLGYAIGETESMESLGLLHDTNEKDRVGVYSDK